MDFKSFWNTPLVSIGDGGGITAGLLTTAIVVFIVGLLASSWLSRVIGRRLTGAKLAPDNVAILQKSMYIFLVVVTVLVSLSILNVPITALTFVSGAVAVGVGFGAQNIINNFISGWILMSERPVRIDDFIEIEGSRGVVEKIGNRSTRIRRIDGVHIMVPNSLLMERTLVNWTLVDRNIRTSVIVGVAYGSPVRTVEALIHQAMDENEDVLKEPAPLVVFDDFGDSALIFETLFWCRITGGEKELRIVRSDLRYRIDELFRENDITIAFPQRDLHLKTAVPLPVRTEADHEQ